MTEIQEGIRRNQEDEKIKIKENYDRRHGVQEPDLQVGMECYLLEKRVQRGSARILTNKPYKRKVIIAGVVQTPPIGKAYRVVDVQTGKTIRNLVYTDRLKKILVDRTELLEKLDNDSQPISATTETRRQAGDPQSRQQATQDVGQSIAGTVQPRTAAAASGSTGRRNFSSHTQPEEARRIVKQKVNPDKTTSYFVEFMDGSSDWCRDVAPRLLSEFRVKQGQRGNTRQYNLRRRDASGRVARV